MPSRLLHAHSRAATDCLFLAVPMPTPHNSHAIILFICSILPVQLSGPQDGQAGGGGHGQSHVAVLSGVAADLVVVQAALLPRRAMPQGRVVTDLFGLASGA